jgi:hypothetical protein
MNGAYKKEKKDFTNKLDELDKKTESTMLLPHEVDLKHCLNARLIQLLREEEIRWYQRDNNTEYFHLVANGKHRKTSISQLEDGGQIIRGEEQLKSYITEYYKGLFGPSDGAHFSLDENINFDIPQVSHENKKLTSGFIEQEVKETIFQMKHNKAPGPNGFLTKFYQFF